MNPESREAVRASAINFKAALGEAISARPNFLATAAAPILEAFSQEASTLV